MSQNLFENFPPVSASQWRDRIIKELKGEPFEALTWKNENGFDLQPFYTKEDLSSLYHPAFSHQEWIMSVRPLVDDDAELNKRFLRLLKAGANGLALYLSQNDPSKCVEHVESAYISSTFYGSVKDISKFEKLLAGTYKEAKSARIMQLDPTSRGEIKKWHQAMSGLKSTGLSFLGIDGFEWAESAAPEFLEIALSLSLLTELLDTDTSSTSDISIRTTVGTNLFVQIAKLRAYRRLWEVLKKDYGHKLNLHLICETSLSDHAPAGIHNNLIRSSLQAFAAVCGGCNELVVHPHDALSGKPKPESERLALNQQIILREECLLKQYADIGCGSYFIERLTDKLAERALEEFKSLQKLGGFFSKGRNERVNTVTEKAKQERMNAIGSAQKLIVGVNKFRNDNEQHVPAAEALKFMSRMKGFNPSVEHESKQHAR